MFKILFGISLTFNIISVIIFFVIYKYGFKGIKRKIENYTFDLMDIDSDFIKDIDLSKIERI
jgi:hypothetical protein